MRKIEMNGYNLYLIPESKFKNISISLRLTAVLDKETTPLRTMLAYMLLTGTENLPSARLFSAYLEKLYGMAFGTNVTTKGKVHCLNVTTVSVNQKYLPEKKDLLLEQVQLLNDIFNKPNFIDGLFNQQMFEIKKRELIDNLIALKDNKITYALDQMLMYMGDNDYLGIKAYGDIDKIRNLTNKEVSSYLKKCLETDQKDIYVLGGFDDHLVDVFKANLGFPKTRIRYQPQYLFKSQKENVLEVIESQDITQAKLVLGYTTNTNTFSINHFPLMVFNRILGGDSQSKLFKIIREQHSLCYYISSTYDNNNGIVIISAGIDDDKYSKVKGLVKDILNDCQKGNISQGEVDLAKNLIIAELNKLKDSPLGLIQFYSGMTLNGLDYSLNDYIHKIQEVNLDQVREVGKELTLDTSYFLTGGKVNG